MWYGLKINRNGKRKTFLSTLWKFAFGFTIEHVTCQPYIYHKKIKTIHTTILCHSMPVRKKYICLTKQQYVVSAHTFIKNITHNLQIYSTHISHQPTVQKNCCTKTAAKSGTPLYTNLPDPGSINYLDSTWDKRSRFFRTTFNFWLHKRQGKYLKYTIFFILNKQ